MSSQNQNHFWEFLQSLDPNRATGQGVDHQAPSFPQFPAGFPFGGPGHRGPPAPPGPPGAAWDSDFEWGPWSHNDERGGHGYGYGWGGGRRGGRHGFRGHGHHGPHRGTGNDGEAAAAGPASQAEREVSNEKGEYSPDTMDADVPDPAEVTPDEDEPSPPAAGPGHPRHAHGCGRRGYGRCRRGFGHRGGRHNPPFDFPGMMRGVMNHPFFHSIRDQAFREYGQRSGGPTTASDESNTFSPPVDVFNTKDAYVVHVALPGARKEDIGVTWNPDAGTLDVAGVVHRPGDEVFLETLAAGERRVGLFERSVALPPAGAEDKADVDGFNITAKMEDGILVVVVPKLEKEWTEIRKVDIE